MQTSRGRALKTEGNAKAKSLRRVHAWFVRRTEADWEDGISRDVDSSRQRQGSQARRVLVLMVRTEAFTLRKSKSSKSFEQKNNSELVLFLRITLTALWIIQGARGTAKLGNYCNNSSEK